MTSLVARMTPFVAAVVLAGCGSSGVRQALPKTVATHPLIVGNTTGKGPDAWYDPTPVRVNVGQAIRWVNRDQEPHDVTSFGANISSGPIPYRGSFTWIPTRPGTFTYFCTLHPGMHGTIVVLPKHQ
jgi:plastocyanin